MKAQVQRSEGCQFNSLDWQQKYLGKKGKAPTLICPTVAPWAGPLTPPATPRTVFTVKSICEFAVVVTPEEGSSRKKISS